jgi:hypothetical protein
MKQTFNLLKKAINDLFLSLYSLLLLVSMNETQADKSHRERKKNKQRKEKCFGSVSLLRNRDCKKLNSEME